MARPVIFDSNPGHDDALAHLLALASPQLLEAVMACDRRISQR